MTKSAPIQRYDKLRVDRLWALYPWPERGLPMRRMTITKLLTYRVQPVYVSDDARTRKQPTRAWDYGRIRFFYERLLKGDTLEAIQVDNRCGDHCIYPEPIMMATIGWPRRILLERRSSSRATAGVLIYCGTSWARKTCPT